MSKLFKKVHIRKALIFYTIGIILLSIVGSFTLSNQVRDSVVSIINGCNGITINGTFYCQDHSHLQNTGNDFYQESNNDHDGDGHKDGGGDGSIRAEQNGDNYYVENDNTGYQGDPTNDSNVNARGETVNNNSSSNSSSSENSTSGSFTTSSVPSCAENPNAEICSRASGDTCNSGTTCRYGNNDYYCVSNAAIAANGGGCNAATSALLGPVSEDGVYVGNTFYSNDAVFACGNTVSGSTALSGNTCNTPVNSGATFYCEANSSDQLQNFVTGGVGCGRTSLPYTQESTGGACVWPETFCGIVQCDGANGAFESRVYTNGCSVTDSGTPTVTTTTSTPSTSTQSNDPGDSSTNITNTDNPFLDVTKVTNDSDGVVEVGEDFTFTITIRNTGNTTFDVVRFEDDFDDFYLSPNLSDSQMRKSDGQVISNLNGEAVINGGDQIVIEDLTVYFGNLAPGEFFEIILEFTGLNTTTDTNNFATGIADGITDIDLDDIAITDNGTTIRQCGQTCNTTNLLCDTSNNLTCTNITDLGNVCRLVDNQTSPTCDGLISPNLDIDKNAVLDSDGDTVFEVGETVAFTIVIRNTGNSTLDNVYFQDTYDSNILNFIGGSAIKRTYIGTSVVTGTLSNILNTSNTNAAGFFSISNLAATSLGSLGVTEEYEVTMRFTTRVPGTTTNIAVAETPGVPDVTDNDTITIVNIDTDL